ncbi:MAG TPA: FAD-dependent oxidoreductase [Acidimicrobiia bacterium]|nr:FAD-dependent oxidoreductase [Acidimicrobiia bacterium]
MAKPFILTIDDDPQVLAAVERDLRRRYSEEYRVLRAQSGAEALEALNDLKERGDTVALFIADQRMPQMTGTEFLREARKLYPQARTVLLTAYADTDAAIQAINDVGLDHYLMKPWDPPDRNLYPIVDDLLDDWISTVGAPYEGIRVIGTVWSPHTHDVKEFLARSQVSYRFEDIERDEEAAAIAEAADGSLPVIVLPEGGRLVDPDPRELAERLGMRVAADLPFYDLIVIGAGPAGLAAGVYAASEGLKTTILERSVTGGQAGTSSRIENYLGFPKGISGADLARRAATQAIRLGAEIVTTGEVVAARVEGESKIVTLDNGVEIGAKALVVASGMTMRTLELPGGEQFNGAGLFYGAALGEAATYEGLPILVVGGANSAGQAAMMFSQYASDVGLVVRGKDLESRMSQYLIDQIHSTKNIDVMLETKVVDLEGSNRVERAVLESPEGRETRDVGAVFVFVGARPHSDFIKDLVAVNDKGFILTGPDISEERWELERDPYLMETSVPGIFAAGDIRHGVVRRVASAVGQGSVCISFVHQYLGTI